MMSYTITEILPPRNEQGQFITLVATPDLVQLIDEMRSSHLFTPEMQVDIDNWYTDFLVPRESDNRIYEMSRLLFQAILPTLPSHEGNEEAEERMLYFSDSAVYNLQLLLPEGEQVETVLETYLTAESLSGSLDRTDVAFQEVEETLEQLTSNTQGVIDNLDRETRAYAHEIEARSQATVAENQRRVAELKKRLEELKKELDGNADQANETADALLLLQSEIDGLEERIKK